MYLLKDGQPFMLTLSVGDLMVPSRSVISCFILSLAFEVSG